MRDWANGRARRASLAGDEAAEEAAPRIEM